MQQLAQRMHVQSGVQEVGNSVILYVAEAPFAGSGARPSSHYLLALFYMAWTYKGLYGWPWAVALRRVARLLAWLALFFAAALAIATATAIAAIVLLAQEAA